MKQLLVRGFTIVELLVVIAIIGLISAIILSSLNDARNQGESTKIIAEMDSLAKRAGIEYSTALTYDPVCGSNGFSTSTVVLNIIASINNVASSTVTCNSETESFAASVALNTAYWCVDSEGAKREISDDLNPGVTVCPSS